MLFNSIEFVVFLPIVFVLYWFCCNRNLRLQNLLVVAASYVFYGWWDWRFLVLIAITSMCSWISGILMYKIDNIRPVNGDQFAINKMVGRKRRFVAAANIVLNISILATFKYYDFFIIEFAKLFHLSADGLLLNLMLPVGISFYTFQALSYSIDVYHRKIEPTHDVIAFFAYISFFPQLVAGPIERATNLLPQFLKKREFDYAIAVEGAWQILWGFFKKIVIADNCALIVNQIFESYGSQNASVLLLGAILFSFQIYGDFSGYSDIAIGVSKLFGIKLMRNFYAPYFSRDIAEFWRRWHISLNTWFRDYVYIPLGGSRTTKIKVIRNVFVIFLLSGFWHGANWTFIAWGAYHAILFLPLIMFNRNRKYINEAAEKKHLPSPVEILQMFATFFMVTIGWVIFRSETIGDAIAYIRGIFDKSILEFPTLPNPDIIYNGYGIMLLLIVLVLVVDWINYKRIRVFKYRWVKVAFAYILLFIIAYYGGQPQKFIYFQF